ncbi:MAG: (d)CMP kinase [Chloroflexi bacterium]|nr:(d)CMP kinase [Chloroflexota bacterium]
MSDTGKKRPPIAIDGPAVSGKSSVGKAFASRIGYRFLDTGLMYRAATWDAVQNGVDVNDSGAVAAAAESMEFSVAESDTGDNSIIVNGEDVTEHLHSIEVDDSVSAVSAVGRVREIMVAEQRRIAGDGEIVMVGRDIGTVVLPDAPLKIYLTATARTRAIRRHKDFAGEGIEVELEVILRSMEQRDLKDSSREDSPLRPADDALIVDTDNLSFDQVVDRLIDLAKDVL